jgi:photosystem II stability/assembly factor-like uncharacterized protein
MLVGPWRNQPEMYVGYNGFVGWSGTTRLRSGRWVIAFSSGYWHGSLPQTPELLEDPDLRKFFEGRWENDDGISCPRIYAPRGGRAHIMHSDDEGVTWSEPATLIDTEMDDRHPTILELDDDTLLCTFFCAPATRKCRSAWILSKDGGETWTPPRYLQPESGGMGNGSAIQLANGDIAWATQVIFEGDDFHSAGVFLSDDSGDTFELAAVIKADHPLHETTIAQLPSGRLIAASRCECDIYWSDDGGRTWTDPVPVGVDLFDPHLLLMPNGVLTCFHGSYDFGGLYVILSPDGGQTWHGPGERHGYAVDPSVYGYCHPMVLPDGTVYVVYLHTGGHPAHDARTEAIWGLRVGVNDDADGIEILPAPGSLAALGLPEDVLALISKRGDGNDPMLGML